MYIQELLIDDNVENIIWNIKTISNLQKMYWLNKKFISLHNDTIFGNMQDWIILIKYNLWNQNY